MIIMQNAENRLPRSALGAAEALALSALESKTKAHIWGTGKGKAIPDGCRMIDKYMAS